MTARSGPAETTAGVQGGDDPGRSPPPVWTFVIGLDLGQATDPTALAVLKRTAAPESGGRPAPARYDCVHLERYPLGTPYPAIVAAVRGLAARPELRPDDRPERRPRLAVDATGVGRPVVDLFVGAALAAEVNPVTITGGDQSRRDTWPGSGAVAFHVPKKELVGTVQAGLQAGRLKVVAGLPLAEALRKELLNFQARITASAHEQFGAWREGTHDDLVLAVALAMWVGENPGVRPWRFL